jgi:hypothetical protein
MLTAAVLPPVLLTGCGKKGQDGESKTGQKSDDLIEAKWSNVNCAL